MGYIDVIEGVEFALILKNIMSECREALLKQRMTK